MGVQGFRLVWAYWANQFKVFGQVQVFHWVQGYSWTISGSPNWVKGLGYWAEIRVYGKWAGRLFWAWGFRVRCWVSSELGVNKSGLGSNKPNPE